MEKQMGVTEARVKFAELVDQVRYRGEAVTLLKSGKPAAVLVPVELYEHWKNSRQGALDPLRAIQSDLEDLSEDEALALALEAQQAVRKPSATE